MPNLARLVPLAALALGACSLDEPPAESTRESASGCNPFSCSDNAATAGDGLLFDELRLNGLPNYAHTKLLGAYKIVGTETRHITLTVVGTRLRGVDELGALYTTGGLEDVIIEMMWNDGVHPPEMFEILIDEVVQSIRYLAGDADVLETYLMKTRRPNANPPEEKFEHYACNHTLIAPDPAWMGRDHDALVFQGERYHPTEKRVLHTVDPTYAFLACAGNAAAKMHLYRHTHAGRTSVSGTIFGTTYDQRTTLLKAITADVCGNGSTFTTNGTPLVFDVDQAWFDAPDLGLAPTAADPGVKAYEALWNTDGVTCLDQPRREGLAAPSWTRSEIEKSCDRQIPYCGFAKRKASNWRDTEPASTYVLTAIPW